MRIPSVPLISERSLQQAGLSTESPPRNAFAAEVSQVTPKRNEQGEVRYQITVRAGGQQLTLDSDKPLPEGSKVILAVTDDQPPGVRLVSLQPPSADKALQQVLSQWLASRVPLMPANQTDQGAKAQPLLNSLQQLSQAPTTPTAVRQVIDQFLQQRPPLMAAEHHSQPENASALRTAVHSSGLFYEQRLLSALTSTALAGARPDATPGKRPPSHAAQPLGTGTPADAPQTKPTSLTTRLSAVFQQAWQATKASAEANLAVPTTTTQTKPGTAELVSRSPLSQQSATTHLPKPITLPSALLMPAKPESGPATHSAASVSSNQAALVQLLTPLAPVRLPPAPWLTATATLPNQTSAPPTEAGSSTQTGGVQPALLNQLAQRLEQQSQSIRQATLQPTAPPTEESSPSLMQALLSPGQLSSQDLKATLSRALQLWLSVIQTGSSERSQNSPQTPPQTSPVPLSYGAGPRPEGLRLLQSTLARIETEQFQALRSDANNNDSTPLSLPLFMRQGEHIRSIDLELQTPEQQAAGGRRHGWRVVLHFDLAQLGPLDVEIELNQQQVAATFWSQQSQTLQQLQQQLPPLRSKLSSLGVDIDVLTARHGQLPVGEHNQIRTRLVDLHT